MTQKLQAILRIPRAAIDKLRQGRSVTYIAENCSVYLDAYWIPAESLVFDPDGTQVHIPSRKHIVNLTVTLKRDKSRGRKPSD